MVKNDKKQKDQICHCGNDCKCKDNCNCGNDCKCKKSPNKIIIFSIICVVLLIVLCLCIYFFFINSEEKVDNKSEDTEEENSSVTEEDYINDDYIKDPVSVYGLEGDFYYYSDVVIAKSENDNIVYDIDSDGIKEEIKVVLVKEDNEISGSYKVEFTDCSTKKDCINKTFYFDYDQNYYFESIEVIDFIESDDKLDIVFSFLGEDDGIQYIFDYSNGKILKLPGGGANFINGSGKICLAGDGRFDPVLISSYVEFDSLGNIKKYDIDLSNINKEFTVHSISYSYDKSVDIEDAIYVEESLKIKLLRYSDEEGLVGELNGKIIYLYSYWPWFNG